MVNTGLWWHVSCILVPEAEAEAESEADDLMRDRMHVRSDVVL
jgi:hypothetical protein